MNTIHKYPLRVTEHQVVQVPQGAQLLSAQFQGRDLCLWARVSTTAVLRPLRVQVFGTGHELPDDLGAFVGTAQHGSLVFHVFAAFDSTRRKA